MIIGYARVSTTDQNLDAQLDALKDAGAERMLDQLREGDVVVVTKYDRLARSLRDLLDIVEAVKERGAGFRSLAEDIDTTTPAGELIFHVFTAISEITNPIKITEIRRQTQEWQRQASLNFAAGNAETALKAYDDQGCINNTADSETSAMEALVKDYVADLRKDINNHQLLRLILAHRRKDVAKLNFTIRKSLIENGDHHR